MKKKIQLYRRRALSETSEYFTLTKEDTGVRRRNFKNAPEYNKGLNNLSSEELKNVLIQKNFKL
jgi:hypothetical protein